MTDQYQIGQLVAELVQATQEGRMVWKKTDNPDAFLFRASKGSFIIEGQPHLAATGPAVVLKIFDPEGTQIETIGTGEGIDMFSYAWSSQLQELYSLARNSALQIDTTLNELLSEIRSRQRR